MEPNRWYASKILSLCGFWYNRLNRLIHRIIYKMPKNDTKNIKIQKIAIILKPIIAKDEFAKLQQTYQTTNKLLKQDGFEVYLDKQSAKALNITTKNICKNIKQLAKKVDMFITIGGDGVIISTIRQSYKNLKPTIGINMGKLGFLAHLNEHTYKDFLKNIKTNNYKVRKRILLKITLNNKSYYCFNELVISSTKVHDMIKVDVFDKEQKIFNSYKSDGLMIATPTGSTAYNLSCNGSIIHPDANAYILNSINDHSLTQRSLIVSDKFKFYASTPNANGAKLILDGQRILNIKTNEKIKIQIAKNKAIFLRPNEVDYFDVLKEKLSWGEIGYFNDK